MRSNTKTSHDFTGGSASPDSKPTVVINPPYNNKIRSQEEGLLFLTNNRSSQQPSQKIKEAKKKLRGKKFKVRKEKPFFCGNIKIALLKTSGGEIKEALFTGVPCNSWTCPVCNIHKAIKVKYLLRDIIELNKLSHFLTLTLDPKKIPEKYLSKTQNNTHEYITKLFNHFVTTIKRKKFTYFDEKKNKYFTFDLKTKEIKLKYVWVCEFQKNGNAHLHILFNQYLPVVILRKVWVQIGGGHMMDIKPVRTLKGVSNYLSDYIVKGIKGDLEEKDYGFKYFEKRYAISRSCIRPKPKYIKRHIKMSLENLKMVLKEQDLEWILYNLLKTSEKDRVFQFSGKK